MKNKTILIVEDSITYQQALKRAFVEHGYDCTCASSGEEALTLIKSIAPNLIILDLLLPGMSGREICREIKSNINYRHTPVMMLTMQKEDKEVVEGLEAGVDSYVNKNDPLDLIIRRAQALIKLSTVIEPILKEESTIEEEKIEFKNKKILLVDDDITYLQAMKRGLEGANYEVITASSGEQCFEKLKSQLPDVILLDLKMPEIDGADICRKIRSIRKFQHIAVLMLTASDTQEDVIRSFEAGVTDYVIKSGDFKIVHLRIYSILRRKHFEEETKRIQAQLTEAEKQAFMANAEKEAQKKNAADMEKRNKQLDDLNKTLDLKNDELKKLTKVKSDFLSTMSHELRTPLNAIIGFSEVLKAQSFGTLNEKQKEYINDVWESGKYLLSLINDILDLSKVEAGKMDLELSEFNLQTVVPSCLVMVREKALYAEIEISLDIDQDINSIVADERKLKQIINNLLSNAIKFTPKSGRIGLEVKRKDDKEILFSVWDNGIGIEEKYKDKIFQEFTRIHNPDSREIQGTGLGLVLTKKFIELHGGKIWFESQGKKQGTRFSFTLPALAGSKIQNEPSPVKMIYNNEIPKANQGTPHVLLIEDDPKSAKLIVEYLQNSGCVLDVVSSGEEGLEKARSLMPSFIILDIILPHKDGWDVLIELKMDPLTKDIPILITSIIQDQSKGLALGAVDYLIKPISKNDLDKALARISFPVQSKSQPFKILAIDDDETSLKIMGAILKAKGFQVLEAQDSRIGLELIFQEKPDLILLDLFMPVMTGFDILVRIHGNSATKDIPVIVVTSKSLTKEEKEFLQKQTLIIIEKSNFNKDSLLREINLIRGVENRDKA